MGFRDFLESVDRLVGLALLGLNHALHELPLHVFGRSFTCLQDQFLRLVELPCLKGFFNGVLGRIRGLRLGHAGGVAQTPDQSGLKPQRGPP